MNRATMALLLLCLILCPTAFAEKLSPLFNSQTMMPTDEIEVGMAAIGKSVFTGTQITPFNLKVMAVMEKSNSGYDIIVARILDGPVVERNCGVMGGMSGSPVYINGRLIGAVAYTYIFEKEPVAGITSINSMLGALEKPEAQTALLPFAQQNDRFTSRRGEFILGGRRIDSVRIASKEDHLEPFADAHTANMIPVAPALTCAGIPSQAMAHLRTALQPYEMEPVAGPGSKRTVVPVEFEPGCAFGVPLVWGDFDISTGGTLTYRDGNLVLGFGHPFMESGATNLPISTSWVHDFVPKLDRTDKMMSPMEQVGAMTQDRPWAVGGVLGRTAPSVPVTLTITDETRNQTDTYHVQVVRHPDLTEQFVTTAAISALFSTFSGSGEGTVSSSLRVKGVKGDEMSRSDIAYFNGYPADAAIGSLAEACNALIVNRFTPQDIAEVEYTATINRLDNTAVIEGIFCDAGVARAGEPLKLRVRMRPDAEAEVLEKTVTLNLPVSLEKGALRITVSSGKDAMGARGRVGVMPPTIYKLQDFITQWQDIERGNQLFVVAGVPNRNFAVAGTRLPNLPRMTKSLLSDAPRTDLSQGGTEVSTVIDMPFVVYGNASIQIPLEDRFGRNGKPIPSKPSSGPSAEAGTILPRRVPASLEWAASLFTAVPATSDFSITDDFSPVADDKPKPKEPTKPETKPADKTAEKPADKPSEPAKPEEPKTEPDTKTEGAVSRGPSTLTQTSEADFTSGEVTGIAIRSDGALEVAPPWQKAQAEQLYIMCLAATADAAYAGTADNGVIYRVEGEELKPWYTSEAFGVSALCAAPDGSLLAATMPGGQILKITAQDQATKIASLPDKYIWDILPEADGSFLLATGPDATVYRLGTDGALTQVVTLRQSHAVKLLRIGTDLYIATAELGIVYRLNAAGSLDAVYDAGNNDITDIIADPAGNLIIATGPEGNVLRLVAGREAVSLYQNTSTAVLGLAMSGNRLFAGLGEGGKVIEIFDRNVTALVYDGERGDVPALAMNGTKLYAALSAPGKVMSADLAAPAKGEFLSTTLDAGRPTTWGRLDWAVTPTSAVQVQVRSGNTTDPKDGSWSAWSAPLTEPGRDRVSVPLGQFLQYKLELAKGQSTISPRFDWIRTTYLMANREPSIKEFKPAEGETLRGKFKLSWKMEDPDKDKLRARLMARAQGKKDFVIVKEGITASEYEWSTTSMTDGVYDLRLVVDDGLSNPDITRETFLEVLSVIIDNRAPEVTVSSGPAKQTNGGWALSGYVVDDTSRIAHIAWQASGSTDWTAARLDDGIYDWRYERFLIVTPPLSDTVKEMTLRVRDLAGNVTDHKVALK